MTADIAGTAGHQDCHCDLACVVGCRIGGRRERRCRRSAIPAGKRAGPEDGRMIESAVARERTNVLPGNTRLLTDVRVGGRRRREAVPRIPFVSGLTGMETV